jgi:hypothetical protein
MNIWNLQFEFKCDLEILYIAMIIFFKWVNGLESKIPLFSLSSNLNSPIFWNDQMSCSNWNFFSRCVEPNNLQRWIPSIWHLKTNAQIFSIVLNANAQILSLSFFCAYSSGCYILPISIKNEMPTSH